MNRRELLKFSLLSPLLGLFKKKEPEGLKVKKGLSKTDICNDALSRISETTGTSNEGNVLVWDKDGCLVSYVYERDYNIKAWAMKKNSL